MGNIASFTKNKEFLICVDSDGCAMDTMDVKHEKAFCPALITVFGLEAYAEQITPMWMEINLFSRTRGINRFKGMLMTFERLAAQGIEIDGLAEIANWVNTAEQLSNPNLEASISRTGSAALTRVLQWSKEVNLLIAELPEDDKPFDGVQAGLAAVAQVADIAIVSSANTAAIETEWHRHSLAQYVGVMLGQEAGTKAACIEKLLTYGYLPDHVVMVGDAKGDLEAAQKNGVLFYPILVGQEGFSWQRLVEEGLPKLLHGNYAGNYQNRLIAEQSAILK